MSVRFVVDSLDRPDAPDSQDWSALDECVPLCPVYSVSNVLLPPNWPNMLGQSTPKTHPIRTKVASLTNGPHACLLLLLPPQLLTYLLRTCNAD